MTSDSMSSFGTPMPVGQPMPHVNPVGLGSQIQGSMPPLGSMSQMQSFGPTSDLISSQYGRPQPYGFGDAGLYPGMSQYPIGSQGVMSRRFGYGMMPGLMGPPMGMVGPAMISPPIIGPPVIGPPVMGPPMYPYGGYEPMLW